jgi:Spy/CpxP family protein refolding chaperone
MRTLVAVVALVVGLPAFAALPAAAEEKKAEKPERILVLWFQDLNLTDQQEAKIAEIRKEFHPKVQEAGKELATVVKEEMDKVRDVLTPEQKSKVDAFKEERQEDREEHLAERVAHLKELDLTDDEKAKISEIRKEFHPKIVKALEGLKGVLSDDQRKEREELLKAGKSRREIIASLKLTDDQKAKVESVGKEVHTLLREELEKMRDVLSESQRAKLPDFKEERKENVRDRRAHMVANVRELNLTDDQKTKISEIRKEFRPKVQEAGNKLRGTVREEMEAIMAVIKG